MNPSSWRRFQKGLKNMFLMAGIVAAVVPARLQAQELRLTPALGTNGTIQLTLTGATDKYHRLDYSTNFTRWSPLDILLNTNDTRRFPGEAD